MPIKIGVIGCGAWATTVASLLAYNNHKVMMWCHKPEYAQAIHYRHENPIMPGIELPLSLQASTVMDTVLHESQFLIWGIASPYVKETVALLKPFQPTLPLLSLTKGLLNNDTLFTSDFLNQELAKCSIAVLSGPNLALEIMHKKPAASVVASENSDTAKAFQGLLSSSSLRLYTSPDIRGVELGGILKNIMAIASGITDGLNLGNNAKAALITRGLQEMIRFGTRFNAKPETFYGLSGLGDLLATCHSTNSRNWQVGSKIGQGEALDTVSLGSSVPEGIKSVKIVAHIANSLRIDMPITQVLYKILYEQMPVSEAVQLLMNRDSKSEQNLVA